MYVRMCVTRITRGLYRKYPDNPDNPDRNRARARKVAQSAQLLRKL
jgi:hypothetical protein